MQIVIDIPEEIYNSACATNNIWDMRMAGFVCSAIANGTPLPKGHGRLIDYGYVVDKIDDWVNAEEYRYTNATDYLRNRIKNVPTIIEADMANRGESEE